MAKLVTKFKYLKPSVQAKAGRYARYIATREGVEKIDDTQKLAPATVKQKKEIAKILRDFPESHSLLEYADYTASPNWGNASEFISRAIEDNASDISSSKTYADYIATRPGVQHFGTHGLFTNAGEQVKLRQVSEELNHYEGNVWTAILSLRREDAARLGFDKGERWRDLLRAHTEDLSDAFHIPLGDLKWYAAFHNEGHHPHVHLIVYSKNENQGYLAPQGVEQLRSSLAREIFAQDLLSVYQEQTAYRDELRALGKTQLTSIVESIRTGNYSNPALEEKLRTLADRLAETTGKKVYSYLKPEVKAMVDSVVEELASDSRIAALYDLWYQQREEMIRTYTEELPQRIPLWQNEAFKSIRNAVIQNALSIAGNQEALDVLENSEPPDIDPSPEEVEASVTPSDSNVPSMWPLYFQAKAMLDRDSAEYTPGQAVELLTQAAMMGCGVAKYRLGKLLLRGEDVPQDVEEACRWLEESIAEDNNPFSEYLLGKAFLKGDPTEQDIARGEELLRRSAMQNNRYAYYTLGKTLLDGDPLPQNITEGITFLKQSADLRFPNAEYIYGELLYKGEVIPQDIDGAIDYLEQASAAQNPYAAYLAGKIRLTEEPYKDVFRAISHFQIAAKAGNDYAEYQLGKLYFYGQEVPENPEKGMEYLCDSADHGNFYAQQLLLRIHSGQVFSVAMGSLRLLQNLSQLLQETIDGEHKFRIRNIDRKVNQKIQEKKEAHGLKQG